MSDSMDAAEFVALGQKKRSKYGNQRVKEDGYTFDSLAEHRRYKALKLLAEQGEIVRLEVHPRYPLIVNGMKVATYVADFRYWDRRTDDLVTEDVKGAITPVYRMKRALLRALHDIEIVEVPT